MLSNGRERAGRRRGLVRESGVAAEGCATGAARCRERCTASTRLSFAELQFQLPELSAGLLVSGLFISGRAVARHTCG